MRSIERGSSTGRSIVHDFIAIIFSQQIYHSINVAHSHGLGGKSVDSILGHCDCLYLRCCWCCERYAECIFCLRKWKAFAIIDRWTDVIDGERTTARHGRFQKLLFSDEQRESKPSFDFVREQKGELEILCLVYLQCYKYFSSRWRK